MIKSLQYLYNYGKNLQKAPSQHPLPIVKQYFQFVSQRKDKIRKFNKNLNKFTSFSNQNID